MPGSLRELPSDTVHASPMAPTPFGNAKRGIVIATIAAVFMASVGALGTGETPIVLRLTYWFLVMETGALIGIGASTGVHGWGRLRDRPFVEGGLISALIAVPLSIVVVAATTFFFGGGFPGPVGFFSIMGVVFGVSATITAINYATAPVVLPVAAESASPVIAPLPPNAAFTPIRFMARLPLRLRHSRLLAIEAEDHYLRVHTDAGSDLVLMRMSDAIAEIGDVIGARTHRSWWVVRDAVVATDRRATLSLIGGLTVPISRGARPGLAADGWFDA
jgi:hypothetical protein